MDTIQERLFDTKAEETAFELKSFLSDLSRSILWHEGTLHNYSQDAKTQRAMRDILQMARNAAISEGRRMEEEMKTARAGKTDKAKPKTRRKSRMPADTGIMH